MSHNFQPLDPGVTIDPTIIASLTGPDNHTGIFLDPDTVNSSVLICTNDTDAVYIDKYQNVGINNISPLAQLDVNAADGRCIQLTYNGTANTAAVSLASDGTMILSSTGAEVNVDSTSNFNVKSHNGTSAGLKLNNVLVLATADQINYNVVTPGTVSASKSVVVDSNRDVTNLRNVTASQLTGTLQTAAQPNVTSVNTLDIVNHDGSQGLALDGNLVTASAAQLNYTTATPGAASASKALIVDSNKDIASIRNLTASQLSGTLQTAAQPNITSVGTLQGIDLDGSLTGLNVLSIDTTTTGRSLVVNSAAGNCIQMCYDTTSGTPTNYVDMLVSNGGSLTITPSGGDVNISSHNGSTHGLKLDGTLVTATADQINYLQGTLVGSAVGGKALIFDSSRNITNINNLSASQLTGTLQTAAQPNVSSVNVLNVANHNGSTQGLSLNGTLITASASEVNYVDTTPGSAEASKALVLDGSSDISGINSLSATSLTGELQTAAQPNITSLGTLTSITTSGNLTLGSTTISASEIGVIDGITAGSAASSKALVLDSSANISGINSLSATSLTGELQTASQPNITSVTTLDITGHNGSSQGLRLNGDLVTATAAQLNSIFGGGGGSGSGSFTNMTVSGVLNVSNHDGSTLGLELAGDLVTASATELNYLSGVTPGVAAIGNALVMDNNLNMSNINGLSVYGSITVDGAEITGTTANRIAGVTNGTAAANKALVLDGGLNVSGVNSISTNQLTLSASVSSYFGTQQQARGSGSAPIRSGFGLSAYSPTLQVGITITGPDANNQYYQVWNSPAGYSAYNTFQTAGSFGHDIYGMSIVWQPNYSRFVFYYLPTDAFISSYQLRYITSTDGYSWTTPESTGQTILKGTNVAWHATSNQYIFFSGTKFFYSTNGVTSWNTITLSVAMSGFENARNDALQMLGNNYVTHRISLNSGVTNVMYWNGSAWSQAGTIATSSFPLNRAYSVAEDRLYMLSSHPNDTASAATVVVSYIDSFSSRAFNTWAANIQTFSVTNVGPMAPPCAMLYFDNYDVILVGTKSQSSDATNYRSSIRIIRIKNKQFIYNFTDGPTENAANVYRVGYDGAPIITTDWNNNLIIQSSSNNATINSVYWTPTSSSNGITFGSTTITENELAVVDSITPGTATASKALVTDGSNTISGISSISATSITGTIQTAAQPNITSLGTLTNITTSGTLTLGSTAISAAEIGVIDGVTAGTASASKALIVDANKDIASIRNLSATQLTGTIQTAAQPNITSLGTLDSITTSGTLTLGSTTISDAEIGVIDGVTAGTASASKALIVDANKDIVSIRNLSATQLTGTIQTAAQPNITSLGTLDSIATSGSLTLGSTSISEAEIGTIDSVTPGTASAGKALVLDNGSSISGIDSLTATNLTGTLQTAAQPNITSVDVLNITAHDGSTQGLSLDGTLVTASAAQLNYTNVTPGSAAASKALVLDGSLDISGINILSSSSIVSSSLTFGTTSIDETDLTRISGITPGTASASKALIVDANKDITSIRNLSATQLTGTIQTASQPNITSLGTLTSITTSGSLTLGSTIISEAEIGTLDGVTAGTASAGKALVLDVGSSISGINSLSATDLTGTIQTAAQPNITSLGTLSSITTSGSLTLGSTIISEAEIGTLDGVTAGTASASKALVLDVGSSISGINSLSATDLTGTIQTAAQPNITSLGTLTSITTSGTLTLGSTTISNTEIGVIDGVTAGTASASKALVVDANKDITSIRNLSATELTGTIQTAAQPNITSLGTLTSITTSGSLTLGSTSISEAEIGALDGVTLGTAAASKVLTLNSSSNVSGINSLSTSILAVGSPANSNLPVEIGYTTYQFTGAYAYSNNLNAHGLVDASGGVSANYSLRADGRILVTGEVEITSDRRLKKDIHALDADLCRSFVSTTTPVRFNWRSDDAIPDYGYIAQDVLKAGFNDLVTIVAHPGMEGSEDSDGFINPADAKFVFSPGKIIPMLALNQKELFKCQDAKDAEIAELNARIARLEALVGDLIEKK